VTGEVATDYAAAVALVDESNPAQSRLLRKAAGLGHGGGAIFPAGSPEYLTLLTWITDGALP
jgi:8-oxo-dGTP pyrophosphatase MutT (NUDIX family)